jgi:hypothetical protein
MTVPAGVAAIFGWRAGKPNIADSASQTSVAIARSIFESLGIARESTEPGQTLGTLFEGAIRDLLRRTIPALAPHRTFVIGSEPITAFAQYDHLARLSALIAEADPDGTIRSEIGTDYVIRPDVTVGLQVGVLGPPFLHAAVSCKWTIRSDRVQNIRHEGVVLTRHRRGRQPHVVTVTAEPLPTRLASIARGTGEVDCVYHVGLDVLYGVVRDEVGGIEFDTLDELVEQDRLRPLDVLSEVIALC